MKLEMALSRETEIRNLNVHVKSILAQHLALSWRKIMAAIPKIITNQKEFDESLGQKYTCDQISLIEQANNHNNVLAAGCMLFDEWGTSGRIRPNLCHLLQLLCKTESFRVADYVAVKLLNEKPPERPFTGPAAKILITLPIETSITNQSGNNNNVAQFEKKTIKEINVVHSMQIHPINGQINRIQSIESAPSNTNSDLIFGSKESEIPIAVDFYNNVEAQTGGDNVQPCLSLLLVEPTVDNSNPPSIVHANSNAELPELLSSNSTDYNNSEAQIGGDNVQPCLSLLLAEQTVNNSNPASLSHANSNAELPELLSNNSTNSSTDMPLVSNHFVESAEENTSQESDDNVRPCISSLLIRPSSIDDSNSTNITYSNNIPAFQALLITSNEPSNVSSLVSNHFEPSSGNVERNMNSNSFNVPRLSMLQNSKSI